VTELGNGQLSTWLITPFDVRDGALEAKKIVTLLRLLTTFGLTQTTVDTRSVCGS